MPMSKKRRHDWIYFAGGCVKFKGLSTRKRLRLINILKLAGLKKRPYGPVPKSSHQRRKYCPFTNTELKQMFFDQFGKHFGQ